MAETATLSMMAPHLAYELQSLQRLDENASWPDAVPKQRAESLTAESAPMAD
jgi:hypothetical protein